MTIQKKPLKITAIVLILAIFSQFIPLTGLAETAEAEFSVEQIGNADKDVADVSDFDPGITDKAIIDPETGEKMMVAEGSVGADPLEFSPLIAEETERREENTKVFRREDGKFKLAHYAYPVHFEDEDGQWQDIDNTLKEDSSGYENTAGKNRIRLSKIPSKDMLHVTYEDMSFSMGFSQARKPEYSLEIENPKTEQEYSAYVLEKPELDELTKTQSRVTYQNLFLDTDVEYELIGNDIKEYITVKSPQKEYIYQFDLNLNGLVSKQLNAQAIGLYAENGESDEPLYVLDAKVMYDAAGASSDALTLKLTENGVVLTADAEWLNAPERAFPVVIDPSVRTQQKTSSVHNSYVASNKSTNMNSNAAFGVGRESSAGVLRSYIHFVMPTTAITSGDMVVQASLALYVTKFSGSSSVRAIVKRTTEAWAFDAGALTWGTKPAVDVNAESTAKVTSSNVNNWISFDLTRLVKSWYTAPDDNTGLELRAIDESVVSYFEFASSHFSQSAGRPLIEIFFINSEGLEGHMTYKSASLGRSGSASVNVHNGNLVYMHNDISMSGNRMPISISHVWNCSRKGENMPGTMKVGKGFRLNLTERIESISLSHDTAVKYKLIDGDGTAHYYKTKSGATNVYVNEINDKLELTVTKSSGTITKYVLKNTEDNGFKEYNGSGKLVKLQDSNGNAQTLTYSGDKLTKVTDPAGRVATLTYSGDLLVGIKDPAGRTTSYTYSSDRLTRITYPDGDYTDIGYNGSNTTIRTVTAPDGTSIAFSYYTEPPYRVASMTQKSSAGATGTSLSFAYNTGDTTITDGTGKKNTYLFDTAGRVVCVKDNDSNSTFGAYNDEGNKTNTLKYSSEMQRFSNNLLLNHSVESAAPLSWGTQRDSGVQGTLFHDIDYAFMGARSLYVESTAVSGGLSFSQYLDSYVLPGKTYTFSAYVKVSSMSQTTTAETGAVLCAVYYSDGNATTALKRSSIQQVTNGWERLSLTVTMGGTTGSPVRLRVYAGIYNAVGVASFDCLQVEEGPVATSYNLLENGALNRVNGTAGATGSLPTGWTGGNLDSTTCKMYSDTVMQIKGDIDYNRYISQTIPMEGAEGDTFSFGGWGRAYAFPNGSSTDNPDSNAIFGFMIRFIDTSSSASPPAWIYLPFEAYCKEWQYVAGSAKAAIDFDRIEIRAIFKYNTNTAFFNRIHLYRSDFATEYEYDDDGKLIGTKGALGQGTKYTYTGPNVTKVELKKDATTQATYEYAYDSNNNLTKAISDANVQQTYAYDSYGNAIATRVTHKNATTDTPNIRVSGGYTTSGNYQSSFTDARGLTSTWAYNETKGLMTSATDPMGNTVSYQYDADNDQQTKVSGMAEVDGTETAVSNQFSYTNDRLSQITHNGFNYNFEYDAFGRSASTKVGAQPLSSYTYNNTSGNLTRTTYGNGQYVEPVYDTLDRVIQLKYNGTIQYDWSYNNYGLIGYHNDRVSGLNYRYDYDLAQRISNVRVSNGDTFRYAYDSKNNVNKIHYKIGADAYSETITYGKDNRIDKVINNRFHTVTRLYDEIGRVTSRAVQGTYNGSTAKLKSVYSYVAGSGVNGCNTTGLVSTLQQRFTSNDVTTVPNLTFGYEYDDNGNISRILENGTWRSTYGYDAQGQLIFEEAWGGAGERMSYTYDAGGNIKTKTISPIAASPAPGEPWPSETITYTYDSTWKDLLISYNGETIEYDAIGNPTTYRGKTMTWTQGRRLSEMTENGVTTTYKYNADGLRTSKKIGSNAQLNYTWEGSKLIAQSDGVAANRMLFFYDATGEVVGFQRGTGQYMYIKNLQGDVVGLFNLYGQLVCRYTYDTWGRVLSVTDANGNDITNQNHVANLNPIRYRGYYLDLDTGLYYLQQRYYDPETGRFINADSVAGNTGNSTYNLFVYCGNDPVNNADPSGMCACSFGKTSAIICNDHLGYYGNYNSFGKSRSYYNEAGKFIGGKKPGKVVTHAPNSPFPHGKGAGFTEHGDCRKCYIFYSNEAAIEYYKSMTEDYGTRPDTQGLIYSGVGVGTTAYAFFMHPGGATVGALGAAMYFGLRTALNEDQKLSLRKIKYQIDQGKGVVVQGDLFIRTWDTYPDYDANDMLNWEPNP